MYVVTGAAGMIGSAVVWELNNRGIDDILVVDELGTSEQWKNLVKRRFTAFMNKTVFLNHITAGTLNDALRADGPRTTAPPTVRGVVHMGACSTTTERDADYLMDNNVGYSKTLARWALDSGIRFINASSAATYGDGEAGFDDDPDGLSRLRPLNAYGYSKHLFDLWAVRTGAIDGLASIKFFNVYGPNEYHKGDMRSLVNKAVPQIRETGTLRLFRSYRSDFVDGGQKRDFIYVKDCARILVDLLQGGEEINGLFNLGSGTARSWNDLAAAIFSALHQPMRIEYIDMPEILRGKYQYFTEAPMGRLTSALNRVGLSFDPTPLEEAVRDYVQGYLTTDDPYL